MSLVWLDAQVDETKVARFKKRDGGEGGKEKIIAEDEKGMNVRTEKLT